MGFNWKASNISSTRPTSTMGLSITPGNNTMGTWAEILSSGTVARDVYGILININSISVGAAAKDAMIDVGVDPAGGTAYTVTIPSLLCSSASGYGVTGSGFWYYFPLWIKAGSSIAIRGSVNNATVGTARVTCTVFGSPSDRSVVRVGTYVIAYGATAASSSGTAVTSGSTSEGSWTTLGTTTKPHWWWQVGMGINNAVQTNAAYNLDLGIGDASNKFVAIEDQVVVTNTNEQAGSSGSRIGCELDCPTGVIAYGRIQCHTTPDTGLSMIAYGLGG